MNRGILLIDSDPTFRTALTVILQKYRIDVVHEPDADEAIALGATHKPSLIVVGVEEPDKLGFKTFQRIKKGPLSGVPIMMVTSSVSAESFAKHKGLKTHANEYVDKRTTSKEALAAKLDALIEFGPAEDDLDIPVEVSDDINLSGEQNVLDEEAPETEYASDQKTAMGGPEKKIDASVAEDVDDAFAGMMGGDEVPSLDEVRAKPRAATPPPVRAATPPPVEEEEPERDFEDMPQTRADHVATLEALRHEKTTTPPPVDGVPEAENDFDDFRKEPQPYAMDDVIASKEIPVDELAKQATIAPVPMEIDEPVPQVEPAVPTAPPSIYESQPAIPLDVDDVEVLADGDVVIDEDEPDSGGVPEPVHHPRSAEDAAEAAAARSEPRAESRPKFIESTTTQSSPAIDLGLDRVAEDAAVEQQSGGYPRLGSASDERDQSGVYDRRALRKIGELERQIAQMKTELERARTLAEAAAKGGGREQTFLNLREKMLAAENELKKVRVDLRTKETELEEVQAKLRAEVANRTASSEKAGELEQQFAAANVKVAAFEKKEQVLKSTVAGLEDELGEKAEALAAIEKVRAQLEADLASERAMRASNASEAERQLRVEREQMIGRHQGELAALRQEMQTHLDAALEKQRQELEAQHAGAVAAAIEGTRGEVSAEAEDAIAQLEAQRESDINTLRAEHQAQIAKLSSGSEAAERERQEALSRLTSEHEQALARLKSEHDQALARAVSERDAVVARTRSELEAQLADLKGKLESQLAHTQADLNAQLEEAAAALEAATAEHETALAEQAQAHAAELANQANQHAAAMAARERELLTARQDDAIAHTAALAELKAELDKVASEHGLKMEGAKRELDELMALHESNKSEIVEQHEQAKAKLAQDHADEIARLESDKQRATEDIARAVAEARAQAERVAEQHKGELASQREASDRELAELRQMLLVAKKQMEEAAAKHAQERGELEQAHSQALAEQKAQHERAIAVANGEIVKVKAVADSEHGRTVAALKADHEKQRKEMESSHKSAYDDVTTERDELKRGLSAARDTIKRSEGELATAVQTIADRNAELRTATAAISERDQRIADLRKEIEAIEQENANYQEQVLRAYQKIKADEAMVARAKKAMAIALTVLDDQGNPKTEPT